ncbi:hypothetical protein [Microbacterium jejuense]|uniref:hypothetical protein n=1 Tax=Microbacterium jejuense TaxID=1263637 RepID=UPI0031EBC3F0
MTTPAKPLEFELRYHMVASTHNRKAAKFTEQEFTHDPERVKVLPIIPPGFVPVKGDWPTVNREANRLNDAQLNSGILDYFFFPEATPADWNRTHCPACKRNAAREMDE